MKIYPAAKALVHSELVDFRTARLTVRVLSVFGRLVNHGKGKCKIVPKIYYYDPYGSVSDQCEVPCLPPDCDITIDFIWDSPVWYVSGLFSNWRSVALSESESDPRTSI